MKHNKFDMRLEPRPELERFEPYQGGLSLEQMKRQYKIKDFIKLASNENPYGPSPKGLAAFKKKASDIYRYPESKSIDLRCVVADRFKVDIAHVIIGSGSDEIISLLAKAYLTKENNIVISEASFLQYKYAAHLMGSRVIEVPMKNHTHDLLAMANAVTAETKIVFIANPNNPTGTYNKRDEVDAFLTALPAHVLPVFDEAYFEYARVEDNYPSGIEDFFKRRPLVVLRTFSKIFGLAGLRVGYGVAPDWCVMAMDKVRPPFNVTKPAQDAAREAFYDQEHVDRSVRLNKEERTKLTGALGEMGFDVIPSIGNFVLFKVSPLTGQILFQRLLRKGIIARSVDEYGLTDYLRVTVGKANENKKFLTALEEVRKEK